MREVVLNTTLNNNTRPTPTIPWFFLLAYLLLSVVLSRSICTTAGAIATDALHTQGEARLCSVAIRFQLALSCPVPPSRPPAPPSSSQSSIRHAFALALAPASRYLRRPEPPSLSATGAVSVAYHPQQLSAARLGKRNRRAIFAPPLSAHPRKSSACHLSLPPGPCATEAEGSA